MLTPEEMHVFAKDPELAERIDFAEPGRHLTRDIVIKKSDPIPELLMKRVKEFDIPEWPGQACFERVIVYRIPDDSSASETYAEGGVIVKPENRLEADKDRSPRGVVVSAGLAAMDILVSNGMQVGELVWFAPHVPFRFEVGKRPDGQRLEFYFMNVGDIVLSEDILQRTMDGEIVLGQQGNQHMYNGLARTEPSHTQDER